MLLVRSREETPLQFMVKSAVHGMEYGGIAAANNHRVIKTVFFENFPSLPPKLSQAKKTAHRHLSGHSVDLAPD